MSAPATLAAYAAVLVVVFGAAVGVGQAVGPVGTVQAAQDGHGGSDGHSGSDVHGGSEGHSGTGEHGGTSTGAGAAEARLPEGLSVTAGGWTLQLERAVLPLGEPTTLAFRIVGADGAVLRDYVREHEKDLHLIVVRRDSTAFSHLHPERDADGRWTTTLRLDDPGTYKVLADFVPAAAGDGAAGSSTDGLVLASDVTVPGPVTAAASPVEQRTAVVDGYTVRLDGDLVPGTSSRLVLSVSRDGRPVTDLEPYLGAYGHLVALRGGDLAYLHVHPEGDAPDGATGGPDVVFAADVPSAATYRLFLDFAHGGQVRTASFTLPAGPGTGTPSTAPSPAPPGGAVPHDDDGHGHR